MFNINTKNQWQQNVFTYLIIFIVTNASYQICQVLVKDSFQIAFQFV